MCKRLKQLHVWAYLPETSVQGDEAVGTGFSKARDCQACLQLLHNMLCSIRCSLGSPVAIKDCHKVAVAAAGQTLLNDMPVLHPVFTTQSRSCKGTCCHLQ